MTSQTVAKIASIKLLSMGELKPCKGIPYSKPHLWRLIKMKKFPAPVRIGQNRVAFVEDEIDAWLQGKIAERDGQQAV
jgi:prophage regulatory protein